MRDLRSAIPAAAAAMVWLGCGACAPAPEAARAASPEARAASRAMTRDAPAANRFVLRETYTTVRPVLLARRGKVLLLAAPGSRPDPAAQAVATLPAGTRIRIDRVQRANTLTHGEESWPQGTILNGRWAGTPVVMAQHNLRSSFHRGPGRKQVNQ